MSDKYKFHDPVGTYFVTSTIVGWVDVFIRPELKMIIVDSLRHCQQQKGLRIHAWCLMTSHLHMIVSSDGALLPGIMRDFKKFTSRKIIDYIKNNIESRRSWMLELFGEVADALQRIQHYKVWQDGNHPILLYSQNVIEQKLRYIHNNPVVAGVVDNPEDYVYSSARVYHSNKPGLIDVECI